MVLSRFYFGGESSTDYGLAVSSPPMLSGAERSVTLTQIPGRNGALIMDDGYYNNVELSYETWAKAPKLVSQAKWARQLKGWLLSQPGEYRELYDSYDPNYCRFACYTGGLEIDATVPGIIQQTLKFTAKPFAYLRSSLTLHDYGGTDVAIVNPTRFPAYPLVKIYGDGNITLETDGATSTLAIESVDGYVVIDSERMAIYKDTQSLMSQSTVAGWPVLNPGGQKQITATGNVTKLEIAPRWRAI